MDLEGVRQAPSAHRSLAFHARRSPAAITVKGENGTIPTISATRPPATEKKATKPA